jgi:hypothetical protein
MKTEVSPITYIMQNFLTEDIMGAFIEYNDAEDPEWINEFIEQSTILEVVNEFVDNCNENGENAIDVLNNYMDRHYITISPKM